ncbi:MAG: right-handed parallel beta-helix repeat-containing protein [Panacibacter sp.]
MRQKLLLITLIISTIVIISSCQKEVKTNDINTSEQVQKRPFDLQDVESSALQYRAMVEKSLKQTDIKLQAVTKTIEKLKSERSQMHGNSDLMAKPKKGVIHVPADYSTLQEAVDSATQNCKILVTGSVSDLGDVLIDVPDLTILGDGNSATINGNILMITAANITIKNLTINMAVVISGTSNAKLINNNLSAANSVGAISPFLSMNSNNNTIMNCHADGIYQGGSYEYGFYLDSLSNNNEINGCIAENTSNSMSSSAFRIDGANNFIKNCSTSNFTRGFSSFGGYSKNNQYIGCVANNSNGDAGFVFFLPDESNLILKNCTANNNITDGFFIDGGSCNVSNCTANANGSLGILVILNDFIVEKNTFSNNGYAGIYIYGDNTYGLVSGTIQKNTIESNFAFGIYLTGVINSAITKNASTNNPVCDFNQTNCSGNILTGNTFGTSCTGL